MPELPEVETIKRELGEIILGKKIKDVLVYNPKVIKGTPPDKFKKALLGIVFKNILRKAKVLIFELSSGKFLVIHLKMTGQLVYPGDGEKSRVSFKLSDGKFLDFNDQRLFAEMRLMDNWRDLEFIKNLGPEPFEVSLTQFKKILSNKKIKIKPLLMEQSLISGIGNLYAAEILFRAKINPLRPANTLSDKEKEKLFYEMIETLKEAIRHKGSSVDQYVQLSGQAGDYVKFHKVYDREGKPCSVCKTSIKRITLGSRGTYFCPKCQK